MERAEALGEAPEDPLLLFSFLWGVWSANYVRFNGEAIKNLASQFMTLAERQGTKVPLMVGHRLIGMSALHTGDIAGSRSHFDRTIALYDPAEHRALAPRFGQDVRVAALSFRGTALWLLGYPDRALASMDEAIGLAERLGHLWSLDIAYLYGAVLHLFRREPVMVIPLLDAATRLATEQRLALLLDVDVLRQGALLAQDWTEEATAPLAEGLTARISTGLHMYRGFHMALLGGERNSKQFIDDG